jgi:hypothetical protein
VPALVVTGVPGRAAPAGDVVSPHVRPSAAAAANSRAADEPGSARDPSGAYPIAGSSIVRFCAAGPSVRGQGGRADGARDPSPRDPVARAPTWCSALFRQRSRCGGTGSVRSSVTRGHQGAARPIPRAARAGTTADCSTARPVAGIALAVRDVRAAGVGATARSGIHRRRSSPFWSAGRRHPVVDRCRAAPICQVPAHVTPSQAVDVRSCHPGRARQSPGGDQRLDSCPTR